MEMSIAEQMMIVAQEAHREFQMLLMYFCIASIIALGVWVLIAKCFSPAWEAIRKFLSLSTIEKIILLPCILCLVYVGSTKHIIKFDDGLTDNGSYATNNIVHIAWTYDSRTLPSGSALYIDWRSAGTTNEWENIAITTVGANQWNSIIPSGATNYDYFVWSSYIPPVPVHTNGVWEGYGGVTRNGNYITLRGRIVDKDGKWIADPKNKREYEEQHKGDNQ